MLYVHLHQVGELSTTLSQRQVVADPTYKRHITAMCPEPASTPITQTTLSSGILGDYSILFKLSNLICVPKRHR